MSLLLTKTCEYAILVTIQQGRYFQTNSNVKIETELDLKLPPSIDDLIPTNTKISSPVSKVDVNGSCSFNVSLVYFVSFKQLTRLRRNEATMSILIKNQDTANNDKNNKITFFIAEAKEVIPQSEHKLDHIYKFVSDKGAWCTIAKTRQQLKVGLFYVAMPDNNNNHMSSNNSIVLNTPCIQLRSPPPTPIMPKRVTATNSNRKKKISSILGTSNSVISCASSLMNNNSSSTSSVRKKKSSVINTMHNNEPIATTTTPTTTSTKSSSSSSSSTALLTTPIKKIPLRRTKSSLVDLNIEELANVLKKMNIFSNNTPPPLPATKLPVIPPEQSYHQIGKGTLQYTFYFKIIFVDHFKQNLLRQSAPTKKIQYLKKPYFGYSFLSTYNLSPVASINLPNQNDGKYCFQLRGHFIDIQNWLHAKKSIELSFIITDKYTKETVGKSIIPLKTISYDSKIMDKMYPVNDLQEESMIAKVTVRIGLVSGWHKEEEYDKIDTRDDPWDIFNNKKQRHHSQSSVPTLLTSSTTSSTKSSTNQMPSIQYIQRPSLKKSKYMTSYK